VIAEHTALRPAREIAEAVVTAVVTAIVLLAVEVIALLAVEVIVPAAAEVIARAVAAGYALIKNAAILALERHGDRMFTARDITVVG
jgi:hypothetical protein